MLPKVESASTTSSVSLDRRAVAPRDADDRDRSRRRRRSGDRRRGRRHPGADFWRRDFTADLGIPRTLDGEELLLARSQVVLAAAPIGADAIDAVFVDLKRPTPPPGRRPRARAGLSRQDRDSSGSDRDDQRGLQPVGRRGRQRTAPDRRRRRRARPRPGRVSPRRPHGGRARRRARRARRSRSLSE